MKSPTKSQLVEILESVICGDQAFINYVAFNFENPEFRLVNCPSKHTRKGCYSYALRMRGLWLDPGGDAARHFGLSRRRAQVIMEGFFPVYMIGPDSYEIGLALTMEGPPVLQVVAEWHRSEKFNELCKGAEPYDAYSEVEEDC
jgi:hypothetical protein